MARIEKPNFTQVPNELIDLCLAGLSEGEFKVSLFVLRHTSGCASFTVTASLSDIAHWTRMSRSSTSRSCRSLLDKGILAVSRAGNPNDGISISTYRMRPAHELPRLERRRGSRTIQRVLDATQRIILLLGYAPMEWRCIYCSREGGRELGPDGRRWHVDHIYPKAHGGDNNSDNKVLSCATCNLSKNIKPAVCFMQEQLNG